MDPSLNAYRGLPIYASLPVLLFYVVALYIQISREQDKALRVLIFALGARMMMGAFFYVTFAISPLGLSWNALGTISFAAIGFMALRRRAVSGPLLISILPLVATICISAAVNSSYAEAIGVLAKYAYFCIIVMLTIDALFAKGVDLVSRKLLLPLSIPFVFQIVSIPLGVSKASEGEGAASYIGGFNHEASFSVALCITIFVLCFIRNMKNWVKGVLIAWATIAVILANYRTAVLAFAPLLGVAIMTGVPSLFVARQRRLTAAVIVVAVVAAGLVIAMGSGERYQDVAVVLERGASIIKPPNEFTIDDRHIMSGRTLIWSQYIYGYLDGTTIQRMVGFGAETWSAAFHLYAHNTLVSTLYELGIFGVAAMLFLWVSMFLYALRVRGEGKWRLLAAHGMFLILSMATMPFWMIEGLMLYAVICGYTLYAFQARPSRSVAPERVAHAKTIADASPRLPSR